MDPIQRSELENLIDELEVVEMGAVTEATEGDAHAAGDFIDADNIVWGNI